jgi:hypothetical protein
VPDKRDSVLDNITSPYVQKFTDGPTVSWDLKGSNLGFYTQLYGINAADLNKGTPLDINFSWKSNYQCVNSLASVFGFSKCKGAASTTIIQEDIEGETPFVDDISTGGAYITFINGVPYVSENPGGNNNSGGGNDNSGNNGNGETNNPKSVPEGSDVIGLLGLGLAGFVKKIKEARD